MMRGKAALAVAVVTATMLGPVQSAWAECADADLRAATAEDLPRVTEALFCLHNEERAANGLPAMRWSTLLAQSAAQHSGDMVARGYFGHDTPEGKTPTDRMRDVGYIVEGHRWGAAENVAFGNAESGTARSIFGRWLASSGHRANILADEFVDVGFGIVLGSPGRGNAPESVTYTANFGFRDMADDDTVRSSPSGPSLAPPPPADPPQDPPAQDPPQDEPGAVTGDGVDQDQASPPPKKKSRKLRRCLKKVKASKKGKRAKRRARARCKARYSRKR